MKIRSITYFMNPGWPIDQKAVDWAGTFINEAREKFIAAGYEVQTTRLATTPFPDLFQPAETRETIGFAQELEAKARSLGYEYLSLGPALPERTDSYQVIPEILAATQSVFLGGVIAAPDSGVALAAVRACAEIVCTAAQQSSDGFVNLRFASLANVAPGCPFFPAAYHKHNIQAGIDQPAFALATEAADLAVETCTTAKSLQSIRRELITSIETHAQTLTSVGDNLAKRFDVRFSGLDFSLAPFPEQARSIGTAIERLGVPAVGMHGSLAAAAFLAAAIDAAQFRRVGFSGLFLPLLEDATLASRGAEGTLTITDLLLYSAVCGTGLDTLPLPGEVSKDQVAAILLDVAALALRLDKPLTARLMPIPGKKAGDPTGFDFAYFANSRVLEPRSAGLGGLFAGEESFTLKSRGI